MQERLAVFTSGAVRTIAAALLLLVCTPAAAAPMTAPDLSGLLVRHDLLALSAALDTQPALSPEERAFYAGIIANRRNQHGESLVLLRPVLDHPPKSLAPEALRIGFGALASSYAKLFRYRDAAATLARMQTLFANNMDAAEAAELEEQRQTMALLAKAPPQRVIENKAARLAATRNALGLTEIPVSIGAKTKPWIFDTGANFSLVVRSVADALHVPLSKGHTLVTRAGGARVEAHVAIVPEMTIGGTKLANVVLLVVDDKDFYFEKAKFQLKQVLGYPVLAALGRITIGRDGSFFVGGSEKASGTTSLWLDGLTPLVAVKPDDERAQLFVLDSGTGHSFLSVRFFEDNRAQFEGRTPGQIALGARMVPAYGLQGLSFAIGEAKAKLPLIAVAAAESGTPTDLYYGAIGQDILGQFQSYTLDFHAMTFSVGEPAQQPKP